MNVLMRQGQRRAQGAESFAFGAEGVANMARACNPAVSGAFKRWITVSTGTPRRFCSSSIERKRSSKASNTVTNPSEAPKPLNSVKNTT